MSDAQSSFRLAKREDDLIGQPLEVYHLAHDLRGPLNSILGFTELLLDGIEGPLNDYQEADITAIHQSAQNLLRLINTVVDLSKLEAQRLELNLEPINLLEVIETILAFDFGTNKPAHIELCAELPATLPPINGQPDRVEQMIMNLLRFGFKTKTAQVVIRATSDDHFVTVEVDVGPETFSEEELTAYFQLGVILDATGHSHLTRGGVDLPLVRQLADLHQAELGHQSKSGEGTVFWLKFPRVAQ